eukprot:354317-Chlamydomonas_euryale.AAC.5
MHGRGGCMQTYTVAQMRACMKPGVRRHAAPKAADDRFLATSTSPATACIAEAGTPATAAAAAVAAAAVATVAAAAEAGAGLRHSMHCPAAVPAPRPERPPGAHPRSGQSGRTIPQHWRSTSAKWPQARQWRAAAARSWHAPCCAPRPRSAGSGGAGVCWCGPRAGVDTVAVVATGPHPERGPSVQRV